MKKLCVLGIVLCGASLRAMDDSREENIAFFRAVPAGQLRVIGQHQIAFPGYENGRHVKSPQEIKRLYECGLIYKASCERMKEFKMSEEDETANWILQMFSDFIDDKDIELQVSILDTADPDMVSLLEKPFVDRMHDSSNPVAVEFATIISELKEKRSSYKAGLASGELGQLQAVLDLKINLFVSPLRAIAYDAKNKESGERLIPESWSSSPQLAQEK